MRASVRAESWPIRGEFRIARGAKAEAEVVVVELVGEHGTAQGEAVPYARYGESVGSVVEALEASIRALGSGSFAEALEVADRGAARNALDCAWWDLRAKESRTPAWSLAGRGKPPSPITTMRTVSVDAPRAMHDAASTLSESPVIKVKVDGGPDLERIEAVHSAAPNAELVVDANEAWSEEQTRRWVPELARFGVSVLEQPLPAGRDEVLDAIPHPVPICADESFHARSSFDALRGRYDMVNVKLDKTGGLTEALACMTLARARGLQTMVGCMVSTSLGVEPALLLADDADYVDLDGPLLLETDRAGARHDRERGVLHPSPDVWGGV
jgi:L-alanine-DL-glutamate epimerase-like enolase superfamily enzyme